MPNSYRAEGRRLVCSFKSNGETCQEAKCVARRIAQGNEAVAALSAAAASAFKFAVSRLARLCADLNATGTDAAAQEPRLSLEDAISEHVEANRASRSAPAPASKARMTKFIEKFIENAWLSCRGR